MGAAAASAAPAMASGGTSRKGKAWKEMKAADDGAKAAVPEALMGPTPATAAAGERGAKKAPAAVSQEKRDEIYANLVDMGGSVCFLCGG